MTGSGTAQRVPAPYRLHVYLGRVRAAGPPKPEQTGPQSPVGPQRLAAQNPKLVGSLIRS